MLTPQEVSAKTFDKAVFGGYDMDTVDDFFEPLIKDYTDLYKENAVLKSKMKVLAEKIEEYRRSEDTMKKVLVAAQKTADDLIAETEKKCAKIVADAEKNAAARVIGYKEAIAQEEDRLLIAKKETLAYVDRMKQFYAQQVSFLDGLASLDIHSYAKNVIKAYDYEAEPDHAAPEVKKNDDAEVEVLRNIEDSLGKITAEDSKAIKSYAEILKEIELDEDGGSEDDDAPTKPRFQFMNLQFGKDFEVK